MADLRTYEYSTLVGVGRINLFLFISEIREIPNILICLKDKLSYVTLSYVITYT